MDGKYQLFIVCMHGEMRKAARIGRETMAIEVPVGMDVIGMPRLLNGPAWEDASLLRGNQKCSVHLSPRLYPPPDMLPMMNGFHHKRLIG